MGAVRTALLVLLVLSACWESRHMRATVVRPLGLITQPNQHGQYPDGALALARNVHLRNPGELTTLPRPEAYRADPWGADIMRRMWPGLESMLVAGTLGAAARLRWVSPTVNTSISYIGTLSFSAGKVHAASHRGRWYVTSDQGLYAIPSEGAAAAEIAGLPPPRFVQAFSVTGTDAQAIATNKTASWKALFVRKGSSTAAEFIKIGPPSTATRVDNTLGTTVNYTFRVHFPDEVALHLQVGDYVELYRTETQTVGTDPGEDYWLAASIALTAPDIANNYVAIEDACPDAGLGAALYTNDEEDGPDAAKYPPGLVSDVAMFKGCAFYIQPRLAGYIKVRVPGAWGSLTSDADRTHGIGTRAVTADITNTSAVLTNVSNMRGLAAGQAFDDGAGGTKVPAGTTVVSVNVGASQVTLSAAAIATQAAQPVTFTDQIAVDTITITAAHPYPMLLAAPASTLAANLMFDQPAHIQATASAPVTLYGVELTVREPWYPVFGVPTLKASNGQNYDPPLPSLNSTALSGTRDERKNRLAISEPDQPEAVASGAGNELLVGSGELYRVISTTDAVWVWASDGLYRVSGEYPNWRVDPVDTVQGDGSGGLILASRLSVGVLKGAVWANTQRGLVQLDPGGFVQEISNGIVGDILPGLAFAETWDRALVCDEANDEVHVIAINGATTEGVVYHAQQKGFTTTTYARTGDIWSQAHAYAPYLRALVWVGVQSGDDDLVRAGSNAALAMPNTALRYQPVNGDGDPFTLKHWIDCNYAFVPSDAGLTVLPSMNGDAYDASLTFLVPYVAGKEGRGIAGVGSEHALAPTIAPGFSISAAGANDAWRFRGLSLRWLPAAEESL